ncbi:alanine racemase [Salidesulfovibrio brasiliensis]|uniref:alanine racemase n=1 Tax=Salidesulfovibrio brasiliensis TaxID=221711 RepID=UPI0006CF8BAD|nr:alanine racemase [Salidesulfovibrio brasiliensis]
MTITYSKLLCHIDLDAIRHNYRQMKSMGGNIIAVIKSDAYGHGLIETARALVAEGAETFAVGYVHEAVQLKEAGIPGRIIALLGPVDKDDCEAMIEHDIIGFVGHFETLARLAYHSEGRPVRVSLKFDTGMSRLGFTCEDLPKLKAFLRGRPNVVPVMASSHLAVADEPERVSMTEKQAATFGEIVQDLRASGFRVEANLANSAAIMGHPGCHHDSQRAGIALYGGNPFAGTEWEHLGAELKPAMAVSAPILHVHQLDKGVSISYGHTYTAERDMTVAVVGAGYADCYSRGLSNTGFMNIGGVRCPIVGRVCMQMTAVDISALAEQGALPKTGDDVWLLGGPGEGSILPQDLADWWGTITYEVFCVLGLNRRAFLNE